MANQFFNLNSGFKIPVIGFGTFQIRGSELIRQVIDYALEVGYRHIDTAVVYGNEEDIGNALQELLPKYNLKREDIFITSKLIPKINKDEEYITELIKNSLKNLKTNYIDLYLIHWPGVSGLPVQDSKNKIYRLETWKTFGKLQKNGFIKSIGVSNFNINHLDEILNDKSLPIPDVNQVEWHPHYNNPELLEYCRKSNIFLQAYSSLGSSNYSDLRSDPIILDISKSIGKSPAQILLKWALQQTIGIIPKARSKEHIIENFNLNFTIPEHYMNILNNMYMNVNRKYAWNPNSVV